MLPRLLFMGPMLSSVKQISYKEFTYQIATSFLIFFSFVFINSGLQLSGKKKTTQMFRKRLISLLFTASCSFQLQAKMDP